MRTSAHASRKKTTPSQPEHSQRGRLPASCDHTGHDLSGLPAECFENGKHLGYLTTKAEFGICAHNFRKQTASVSFADACAHGLTLDEEGLAEWIGYQDDPVSLLDQPLLALIVPAAHPHEALAAFPNGYFSCDLGPVLNFAVARHLAEVHGYELIGVGAAYLGFLRATLLIRQPPGRPSSAR